MDFDEQCISNLPVWMKIFLKNLRNNGLTVLTKIEQKKLNKGLSPNYAPIFIIGPPRSGTTLIYQTFARALSLSYICNLSAQFFQCPGLATQVISYITKIVPPAVFKSYYGETTGWSSQNQGREIWCRWFPGDQSYVGRGILSSDQIRDLRGTVALIEKAFQMPFINKAQGHCVRMLPITEAFPNAVFIRVRRDFLRTAQSIYFGRKEYFGNAEHWISVRPMRFNDLKNLNAFEQVCKQVLFIEEDINDSINKISDIRLFEIFYNEFCNNPAKVLREFIKFYFKITGIKLKRRATIPTFFTPSNKIKISYVEFDSLKREAEKLEPHLFNNSP